MGPHRRTLGNLVAGSMLATVGVTGLVGCTGSADDAASDPTRADSAENDAAPALAGVTVDVRRDPG